MRLVTYAGHRVSQHFRWRDRKIVYFSTRERSARFSPKIKFAARAKQVQNIHEVKTTSHVEYDTFFPTAIKQHLSRRKIVIVILANDHYCPGRDRASIRSNEPYESLGSNELVLRMRTGSSVNYRLFSVRIARKKCGYFRADGKKLHCCTNSYSHSVLIAYAERKYYIVLIWATRSAG